MRPTRTLLTTLLLAALGPAAWADDPAAEAALKEKGLVRSGSAFVVEAETPVLAKMKEVGETYAPVKALEEKRAMAQQAYASIMALDESRTAVQANLAEANAMNDYVNGIRTGLPPRKSNLFTRATMPDRAQLTAMRDQFKGQIAQIDRDQKQLGSQIPSEKQAAALEADYKAKVEALKAGLVALRPSVDEVLKRYDELKADESVKKAMAAVKKDSPRTKLGPSDLLADGVKTLARLEKTYLREAKKPVSAKAKAKAKSKK